MIKKKQIAKLEYAFDKRLHIASDFDLIIRLSRFCYFDYVPEVLCNGEFIKVIPPQIKKRVK